MNALIELFDKINNDSEYDASKHSVTVELPCPLVDTAFEVVEQIDKLRAKYADSFVWREPTYLEKRANKIGDQIIVYNAHGMYQCYIYGPYGWRGAGGPLPEAYHWKEI